MARLQRTYLRQAVYQLLKNDTRLAGSFGESIFASRIDPYLVEPELPALGLYILKETALPDNSTPPKNERQALLIIQVVCHYENVADNFIDDIQARIEEIMQLNAIGLIIKALGGSDTLLELHAPEFELAMSEDDGSNSAVGIIAFQVDYVQPELATQPVIGNFQEMHTQINSDKGPIEGHIELSGPWPD